MPELPEVETIRLTLLHNNLLNKAIKRIYLEPNRLLKCTTSMLKKFKYGIKGECFITIERIGKYLFLIGTQHSLIIHFGMSGVINWYPNGLSIHPQKHEYLAIHFEDKSVLSLVDPRTFGKIIPCIHDNHMIQNTVKNKISNKIPQQVSQIFHKYSTVGKDIFNTPVNTLIKTCTNTFSNSKQALKSTLLNQTIITGVGNIYADESLFAAKLSPLRVTKTLTTDEWRTLLSTIKKTFRKAIARGRSSMSDCNGLSGQFQNKFLVYGKSDEHCPHCKKPFKKIILQKRTTIYCANCQI